MMEEAIKKCPNKRVFAFLIDLLLVSIIVLPFSGVVWFIVFLAYFLTRDALFNGQSLGKLLTGLRVVDLEGNKCTLQRSSLRNIIFIVPVISYIVEYFVMVSTKDERRLGDIIAKTKVEDNRPNIKDGWFLLFSILLAGIFGIARMIYISYLISKV
jgi:uncharacterized RDD family membrane protein YckC